MQTTGRPPAAFAGGDNPETVAGLAGVMEAYLRRGDQRLSGAEWSVPVPAARWGRYLAGFPMVTLAVEDGRISRTALVRLAATARGEASCDAYLDLFVNVLAWGIAGNWRNVSRTLRALDADLTRMCEVLADAAQASYAGQPREAFRAVSGQLTSWGPAFFTKYLHFTADLTDPAKVQCLILDDRVRVAWRCFAEEWLDLHSADHYQRYCDLAGAVARRRGSEPAWVEGRLYQFGRRVRSFENFANTQLMLSRQRLGPEFPTVMDAYHVITDATAKAQEDDAD